jgi:hypothetical protein
MKIHSKDFRMRPGAKLSAAQTATNAEVGELVYVLCTWESATIAELSEHILPIIDERDPPSVTVRHVLEHAAKTLRALRSATLCGKTRPALLKSARNGFDLCF